MVPKMDMIVLKETRNDHDESGLPSYSGRRMTTATREDKLRAIMKISRLQSYDWRGLDRQFGDPDFLVTLSMMSLSVLRLWMDEYVV
jgi:hypothetical protein